VSDENEETPRYKRQWRDYTGAAGDAENRRLPPPALRDLQIEISK
jgi:hypothetical protein